MHTIRKKARIFRNLARSNLEDGPVNYFHKKYNQYGNLLMTYTNDGEPTFITYRNTSQFNTTDCVTLLNFFFSPAMYNSSNYL